MSRSSDEKGGIRYDSQFLRIEELIKGKTFSREEISHLVTILNSRADIELEMQSRRDAREDSEQVGWIHEIPRTPAGDVQHVMDRDTLGTLPEKSDVPVGVGASPINIARAYMAGRTLEQGHNLRSYTSKVERAEPSNKFSQQPPVSSPLPNSSICWPGAVLNDHHGYNTPQSQSSSRYGLRDFPRSPYARTIASRSTAKFNANSRFANTSTPFLKSPTSIYGQVRPTVDSVDVYGSVGPIRRIRNKFASEVRPRESMILSSLKDVPSEKLNSNFFSGVLPAAKKNLEPGETSGGSKCLTDANASGFSDSVQNVNSFCSPAVKKILEHLDRNKPTPKEKEAETKLVTEWKKISSNACDTIHEENTSSLHTGELASLKKTGLSGLNSQAEINKSSSSSNYFVKFHDKCMDMAAKDAVSVIPKAPSSVFVDSGMVPGVTAVLSSGPLVKNSNENALATTSHAQEKNIFFPHTILSNGPDLKTSTNSTALGLSKNHGTKPSLPSISVNKPEIRAFNSDNGSGFTFPLCTAGVVSEPPTTPSILPSASIIPQPTYSFGANKSNPGLVFTFPSSSNASINDASGLKFSFGSDKKTRLSFSFFDSDAICY